MKEAPAEDSQQQESLEELASIEGVSLPKEQDLEEVSRLCCAS